MIESIMRRMLGAVQTIIDKKQHISSLDVSNLPIVNCHRYRLLLWLLLLLLVLYIATHTGITIHM